MVKFLLFWHKYFTKVSEEDLQPGDLLLVPIEEKTVLKTMFLHAAAYCGEGEVIHLQKVNNTAKISKEGYEAMKWQRKRLQIFRKKDGINLSKFLSKVREAMNWKTEYNLLTNNCIRFALHLVDLAEFYKEMVKYPCEDGECSDEASQESSQNAGGETPKTIPLLALEEAPTQPDAPQGTTQ